MIEILYTIVMTHITIICVTLYLHRGMTHRGIEFHPATSHFMRFWLWLTTGMVTKEWVAVHRKHHRFTDQADDPHSPKQTSLLTVLIFGTALYMGELTNRSLTKQYAPDIQDDWIETHLYSKFSWLGILLMAVIDVLLFGWIGLTIWAVQMVWIPFWAAGVINGVGHYWGYRNGETKDSSTNIVPWGILIGGEELHNNHHLDPASPRLSKKWYEFDIGWLYLTFFRLLGLAKLKTR